MTVPVVPAPVLPAALARIGDVLKDVRDVAVWSLSPGEVAAALLEARALRAGIDEVELRLLHGAADAGVGLETGASSTVNWWAHATKQTRTEAHRAAVLAAGLARRDGVRVALASGAVCVEQAHVIIRALADLPGEVAPEVVADAEAHLLDQAACFDAKALRVLAKHLLEVVDPVAGEAQEAAVLAREEHAAACSTRLTMTDDGHGRTYGRFTLPTAQAAMLRTALLAIAAPKHPRAADRSGSGCQGADGRAGSASDRVETPRSTGPERLGRAFGEYVERYPATKLPKAGGVNATVVVTMTLESLLGGLAAASLDTGDRITAAQARRLACEAGVIPAVLDGRSHVLDLGRRKRFHTPAQRVAMGIQQGGCQAEGCDRPPGMCHAHHRIPWSHGGDTSVKDGRLLCPRHHTRAHDPTYTLSATPTGRITFHRRC